MAIKGCDHCGGTYQACDRCGQRIGEVEDGRVHVIPCPYGSVNAREPMVLCSPCHRELVRLTWIFRGAVLVPPEFEN